jgi:transposase
MSAYPKTKRPPWFSMAGSEGLRWSNTAECLQARTAGYSVRLDAEMIAAYRHAIPGSTCPSDPAQHALAEMAACRRQILAEQVMVENQAETLRDPESRRVTHRRVASPKVLAIRLDKQIVEFIESSPTLAERGRILRPLSGVGAVLCALLPLAQRSRRHREPAL